MDRLSLLTTDNSLDLGDEQRVSLDSTRVGLRRGVVNLLGDTRDLLKRSVSVLHPSATLSCCSKGGEDSRPAPPVHEREPVRRRDGQPSSVFLARRPTTHLGRSQSHDTRTGIGTSSSLADWLHLGNLLLNVGEEAVVSLDSLTVGLGGDSLDLLLNRGDL